MDDWEDSLDFYGEDFCMKNPNHFITLDPHGGIWSADTFPWTTDFPFTLAAPS